MPRLSCLVLRRHKKRMLKDANFLEIVRDWFATESVARDWDISRDISVIFITLDRRGNDTGSPHFVVSEEPAEFKLCCGRGSRDPISAADPLFFEKIKAALAFEEQVLNDETKPFNPMGLYK